jgi:hypothetical protein
MYVDVPGYAALLLRRTYAELSLPGALMFRAQEWLGGTDARWNEQRHTWTFPSGATLTFGYLENSHDVTRYQSAEFQFIGFDELTHFSQEAYTYVAFSRRRRTVDLPVPNRVRSASNPGGIGHAWVRDRFITNRKDGVVFIPAKVRDNPGLVADEYEESLAELPEMTRRQLMDGDWSAFEGRAYPEFRETIHVVDPMPVPGDWERAEWMDHGTANPAAWHAVAFDYDGNMIVFDTYYARGIVSEHCDAILRRREAWYPEFTDVNGVVKRQKPGVVICDPSAVNFRTNTRNRWGEPATIATEYLEQSDEKIVIKPGNNDPRAGRARVSELLNPIADRPFPAWHPMYGQKGAPRLYVFRGRCSNLIDQLETAPLLSMDSGQKGAGEVVDPKWEGQYGHAVAALRYGVMSRPGATTVVEAEPDDPRVALLMRVEARLNKPIPRSVIGI